MHRHHAGHAHTPATEHTGPAAPGRHVEHTGHDQHAGHSPELFRRKFWVALVLTLPVVIWSEDVSAMMGFRAPAFPASSFIPPIFGSIVFVLGGGPFLLGASRELRARLPGMMTLIALAIGVAFVFSASVELGVIAAHPLWWELATLVTIMLLGHWIEMRSIQQAHGALHALAKLLPDLAVRIEGDTEHEVPIHALRTGDLVLVRPGSHVPADGVVRSGGSELDEAMITGESRPVQKREGDVVIAGTINGAGVLRVEVTGTGDDTRLSGIIRLVADAQRSRSRTQHLADRAARALTLIAIGAGVVTFVGWQLAGAPIEFAIVRVVTVLVIACPHALGLAIPLVVAVSTTLGARGGLLIRDRRGLEEARHLDAVIFDKTGTLTLGAHRVVDLALASGIAERDALAAASAVEIGSEHPIARGIVASARERGLQPPTATDFRALPGVGVAAVLDGVEYRMGGPALLQATSAVVPEAVRDAMARAAERGQAAIYLVKGQSVLAAFAVADALRPESREAVASLHRLGIEVAMLTGDARAVAHAVAAELGIDTVFAEVLPADKVSKVRELQARGKRVAMVGDGINDAPALAAADIGIAIGAGTDVAVEAGHIVLVRSDPRDIPGIIALSRATYRKMLQNLWWAAGYNIAAIPLAAGALAAWGILLSPALGAVLMSASTVIVAVNAQLLKRTKLR